MRDKCVICQKKQNLWDEFCSRNSLLCRKCNNENELLEWRERDSSYAKYKLKHDKKEVDSFKRRLNERKRKNKKNMQ